MWWFFHFHNVFGYACQSPVIEHMMKFSRKQPRFFFFPFETGIQSIYVVSASCLALELKEAVPMPCGSQICEMSGPVILHVKIM